MKYNLYKIGASIILKKFVSDIRLLKYHKKKKIKKLYNSKKNKKAIILCNGPSLNKVDFDLLKSIDTFGLNKINLLFDKTKFRPNYIVAVNTYVIEQNKDFLNTTNINLFIDYNASRNIIKLKRKNIFPLYSEHYVRKFSNNILNGIYQGHTVTFVAMQIAYYMGFSKIALVGCDHSFTTTGKANETLKSGAKDLNHFAENYFAGGQQWQAPDLFESEVSYEMARRFYEEDERVIYDCTGDDGKLNIFEKKTLFNFINNE